MNLSSQDRNFADYTNSALPTTASGVRILPIYSAENSGSVVNGLTDPGVAPYTRGIDNIGYLTEPWIMGQYSGYSSPKETNQRFRELIARGQTGLSIALDLPTQLGLDSDNALSDGEVGKVGAPISSLRDVEELFDGIPLQEIRQLRTTANSIGPIAAAMFLVAAEHQGVAPNKFRVMLQNDSLKEYIARNTYIFPPRWGLKFSADIMEFCAHNLPHWEPIEFCGYHVRDAGCNAAQEVAIAAANGLAYVDEVVSRGVDFDVLGHRNVFFLSAAPSLFEEVAKFRSAREFWAKHVAKRFPESSTEARKISIFCYTLGGALTAQEPQNNVVRVAYAALAAALGGVQTLATSSFDEALGLPSREAVQLSLRTQQILAFETGVTDTIDPLGGSYFVESLTAALGEAIEEEFNRIQAAGGAVAAINNGYILGLLEDGAYQQQMDIESGARPLVGVNKFTNRLNSDGLRNASVVADAPTSRRDTANAERVERLKELRRSRLQRPVSDALKQLEHDARSGANTMPAILEAVRAYATLGEICDVLREIWGTYSPQQ